MFARFIFAELNHNSAIIKRLNHEVVTLYTISVNNLLSNIPLILPMHVLYNPYGQVVMEFAVKALLSPWGLFIFAVLKGGSK